MREHVPAGLPPLEAIQRLSTWDELRREIGGGDTVLRFVDFGVKLATTSCHDVKTLEVLTLLDGILDFNDVVRASGLGRLEVGLLVRDLLRRGQLEIVGEPKPRPKTGG